MLQSRVSWLLKTLLDQTLSPIQHLFSKKWTRSFTTIPASPLGQSALMLHSMPQPVMVTVTALVDCMSTQMEQLTGSQLSTTLQTRLDNTRIQLESSSGATDLLSRVQNTSQILALVVEQVIQVLMDHQLLSELIGTSSGGEQVRTLHTPSMTTRMELRLSSNSLLMMIQLALVIDETSLRPISLMLVLLAHVMLYLETSAASSMEGRLSILITAILLFLDSLQTMMLDCVLLRLRHSLMQLTQRSLHQLVRPILRCQLSCLMR